MASPEKVLVTTGITGGHFFPAVCFAESYQRLHPESEIWFLLSRKEVPFGLAGYVNRFRFHFIPIEPFPRLRSWKLFSFLFSYFKSLISTVRFVGSLKPSVVVSFGSYSSFPAVLVAWIRRIPIVIHEQNRIFGRANQWSSLFARQVVTSFPETIGWAPKSKIRPLGYPIRPLMRGGRPGMRGCGGKFCILVFGGSQGSRILNERVCDFFSLLTCEEKEKIAVIHITGEKQFHAIESRYSGLAVQHEVCAFADPIDRLYRKANLVIARAGAGTIFELAVFGLPAILIPYPFAYAHQSENAKYLNAMGAAR